MRHMLFSPQGEIIAEGDKWILNRPKGSFIRVRVNGIITWYWTVEKDHSISINLSDVPESIKAMCFLLELEI